MATCLVLLVDGFETVEAMAPIDVLRRGGVEVTVAGVGGTNIVSAQNVSIKADVILSADIGEFDLVVVPGGMPGSANLAKSETVIDVLHKHNAAGKLIGAICAAPAKVLAVNGFLDGKKATCFPMNIHEFSEKIEAVNDNVVVDGNIITSRGVGTAFDFGFKLLELLSNRDAVDELKMRMLFKA